MLVDRNRSGKLGSSSLSPMTQAREINSALRKAIGVCLMALGMGLASWLYWPCMDSQVTGFLSDDGVYAITAKALATGKGYTLLHLPGLPAQVKYPILYPLLLSAGWLLNPDFPANLPLLHWITAIFAIAAIPLLMGYLRRVHVSSAGMAGFIALLVISNFHFMFYATSLMSEAPYFFCSLLALWIAESRLNHPATTSNAKSKSLEPKALGLMVVCSALAFHTRTIGLTLIAAIGLCLLLQKRWKDATIYLVGALLITVVPWGLWVMSHAPAVNAVNYPLAFVYGGYGVEYGIHAPHDWPGYWQAVLEKGVQPLMDTLLYLLLPMLPYWLAKTPLLLALAALFVSALLLVQGIHAIKRKRFSPSGLYVGLYLATLALWLYPNQAPRFMAMLLPWLWVYFFNACRDLTSSLPIRFPARSRFPANLLSVLLIGTLTLWPAWQGYGLLKRIRTRHWLEPSGQHAWLWEEYKAAFAFIQKHTAPSARIAGMWEPVIYLYTGRTGFVLFTAALQPVHGQIRHESFARLMNSLQAYQVDYVMSEPFLLNQEFKSPLNPVVEGLKTMAPQRFGQIYDSPRHAIKIYRFSR